MTKKNPTTLGELKKQGYTSKSIKDEVRYNLIKTIKAKQKRKPLMTG